MTIIDLESRGLNLEIQRSLSVLLPLMPASVSARWNHVTGVNAGAKTVAAKLCRA